ncbi:ubiquitin-like protein Pup [Streptosporangium vulgare]
MNQIRPPGGGATHGKQGHRRPEADRPYRQGVEETAPAETSDVQERHEKLSDDVDAILDEIDEVLEENAEEFVRSYVQKGGQ